MNGNFNYKNLLKNSLNPFILFDNNGKVNDFNKEAEFLLSKVRPKIIYELALANASKNYGFNHEYINVDYGKLKYYAVLVGYEDEEFIGIELYKTVDANMRCTDTKNIELVNIFKLIEISKNTTLDMKDKKINEIYDISIPKIKVNINNFLLMLNESFKIFENCYELEISVGIVLGKYQKIKDKRYNIISIEFKCDNVLVLNKALEEQAIKSNIDLFLNNHVLELNFSMVL